MLLHNMIIFVTHYQAAALQFHAKQEYIVSFQTYKRR